MEERKTKSIRNIESRMAGIDSSGIRYKVLESAKDFKASWIGLGQALFTVWKDKLYKEWGYQEIETYVLKEIGIKKQTALKLLRSYSFMEKEEPRYLDRDLKGEAGPAEMPTYESVDVLRLAKERKDLDGEDYAKVRKYVLEEAKDAGYVKKDLASMVREKNEIDPDELAAKKNAALLKRLLSVLRSVKTEFRGSEKLPQSLMKDVEALILSIEKRIND
jgi:hypothetical protein